MINTKEEQSWRILHIDDDEDDHIIVQAMLNEAQSRTVKVEWADNPVHARKKLESNAYHAVLVDYDLGVGSGIELIRELNAQGYEPPLILLTGRGNYQVDVEAMHAGATLYLTKNEINPLLLERSIRYAIERKQTETQLRLSEENLSTLADRFKAVLENSLDAAYRRNLQTDRYDYMSPVIEQVLGFTPSEMMDMSISEALERIHPDDQPAVSANLAQAAAYGKGRLEYRFLCKDGQYRWLADYVTVEKDLEGRLLFRTGIVRDVTDQRRSEQALRESEERFQLASRAVIGVLYEWTMNRDFVYQSEGLERLVGYQPGEEPGGSRDWWPRNIHPEDYPRVQAEFQSAIASQQDSLAYEYRIRHREGHWVHILDQGYIVRDEIGQPQRVVGICTDISDRVRWEQALQDSEQRHRQLAAALEIERATLAAAVESLPIGIGITDLNGNVVTMNSAGMAMHGFEAQEEPPGLLEKYLEFFELRDLEGRLLTQDEWPVSRSLRGEFIRDFPILLKNQLSGKECLVSYTTVPVRNSQGEMTLTVYLMVNRDSGTR
jgi:PAS domain S-box-containing protein